MTNNTRHNELCRFYAGINFINKATDYLIYKIDKNECMINSIVFCMNTDNASKNCEKKFTGGNFPVITSDPG